MSTIKPKQKKGKTFQIRPIDAPPDLERMLADARSLEKIGETMRPKARAVRSLLLYVIDCHSGPPAMDTEVCDDLIAPAEQIAEELVALADELFDATRYLPENVERLQRTKAVTA